MTLAHSSLFREIGIVILMISGSVVALFIMNLKFVSVESFVMAQAISVGISMCGLVVGCVVGVSFLSFSKKSRQNSQFYGHKKDQAIKLRILSRLLKENHTQ